LSLIFELLVRARSHDWV